MTEDVAMDDLLDRERALARNTNEWTVRWLVESYDDTDDGREDLADDGTILAAHDYVRAFQSAEESELAVTFGRTQDAGGLADLGADAALLLGRPTTLIRSYPGKQQADANMAVAPDARQLATYGYRPTSQSWAQGQWGAGAFVLALVLAIVLIGILIFLYLLIVKPEGTLTVTYALRDEARVASSAATGPAVPQSAGGGTVPDQIRQLGELRDAGLLTEDEFTAKKGELLGRM